MLWIVLTARSLTSTDLPQRSIMIACMMLGASLLAPFSVFAEVDPYVDSLRAVAFSGRTDTVSARALLSLVNEDWSTDRDSMTQHRVILEREVERYRDAEADALAIIRVELAVGTVLKQMNEPAPSIQHLFAALALSDQMDDRPYRSYIVQEIGLNYYLQANWDKAAEYFVSARADYANTGQEKRLRVQDYLIGLCRNNSGRYREALPILEGIYNKWKADGVDRRILETGSGYADALRGLGHLDSAEAVYRSLILIAGTQPSAIRAIMGRLLSGLAHVQYQQGRLREAESTALEALTYTREFDYFFPTIEAQKVLFQTYRDLGEWERAFRFLESYTHVVDSLQSEETNVQLGVAQAVFKHQQQEAAIRSEEEGKRNVMLVGLILSGVLVLVVGLFYRSLSKQKKLSERLLANILPRETIAELQATGQVTPKVHHNVSIMFCDVREFTKIAEALQPEELVQMLDRHIRKFDAIIEQHGLEKIKTIGDAYMVAGGLHDAKTSSAQSCVEAAAEMLVAVQGMRAEMLQQYGFEFEYRVGIHTGSVISGMVGRDKYAYDIWGDAVNVASRMEHNSEVGKINISGTTRALLSDTIATTYRGKIPAKNKGEIDMYFVD